MSRADFFRNLAQEMAGAYESRVKERRERPDEVRKLLKEFDKEGRERTDEVSKLLKDFDKEGRERTDEVNKLLKDFDKAHAEMSAKLKADLAKDEAERADEVSKLLDDFRKEREEAATAWQNLVTTMQAKRGVPVPPPPKVEVAPPPVEKVPVEEVPEEEAVARAERVEVTPEVAELQRRVFEYLADHPDGTKLVELEREFSMPRLQMARVVKNLIDDNKVEKKERLYFAI